MSTSPSSNICCWTDWFSGKVKPPRQRFRRRASYHAQSGAVVAAKLSLVAACCNTETLGANSISACLRKVAPMKFDGAGWVKRPGFFEAQSTKPAMSLGGSSTRALS